MAEQEKKVKTRKEAVPTQPGRNGGTLLAGSHGLETGRPKGVKNRATLLKKWSEVVSRKRNEITGEVSEVTQEDLAVIALLTEAKNGNVPAFKEMMDTLYGKLTDNLNLTGDVDLSSHIKIDIGFDAPEKKENTEAPE